MQSQTNQNFFLSIIKGALFAVIFSLVSVLIFGLIIKFFPLNSAVIKTVNQFIKVLSVFLGCIIFSNGQTGLIKGLITGVISAAVTYLLFSLLFGSLSFGAPFIVDIMFSAVIGGISGIIAANLKAK